jgi:hypothetical protein
MPNTRPEDERSVVNPQSLSQSRSVSYQSQDLCVLVLRLCCCKQGGRACVARTS